MKIKDLLIRQSSNIANALKHGEKTLTYREWYIESELIAKDISNKYKEKLQCIGIFLPNSIEYAISYFAVMLLDTVLAPIGIQAKAPEIISTIEYLEIDIIITNSEYKSILKQVLEKCNTRKCIYICDEHVMVTINPELDFIEKTDCLMQDGTENDVAVLLHTSGTTSNPKRVMLTHRNLVENIESNIASLRLTSKDVVLIALPMFFGYCNTAQFLTQLYLGALSIIMDSKVFMPKAFFRIVEKEKITFFTGVPSMLMMLLSYRYAEKYDYSSLKYIIFGGGIMPVEKLKMLIKRFPTIYFLQTYGQTECSPRVTLLYPEFSNIKIGSIGTPIPNVSVKIVDKDGNEKNHDEVGEIIVKGNNVMKGYFKALDVTEQIISDGWLHTGDLGYKDADGFLFLTGRIKNIIISGGINIYPEQIEQILQQHDAVENAYVYGEKDEILGEIPIARVELKRACELVELKKYCKQQLSDYKVPVRFEIVDYISKTYNGKVKRH